MKTTVIAALGLFVGTFGLNAAVAEAAQVAKESGSTIYSATCHYLVRANGTTRSGTSSGTGIDPNSAISNARRSVPSGAQVTGCQTTGVRH